MTKTKDMADVLEALRVETVDEALSEIARLVLSDMNNASWATEREAVRAVVFYRGDTLTDSVSSLRSLHDRYKCECLLLSTRLVESRRKCVELEARLSGVVAALALLVAANTSEAEVLP